MALPAARLELFPRGCAYPAAWGYMRHHGYRQAVVIVALDHLGADIQKAQGSIHLVLTQDFSDRFHDQPAIDNLSRFDRLAN